MRILILLSDFKGQEYNLHAILSNYNAGSMTFISITEKLYIYMLSHLLVRYELEERIVLLIFSFNII